MYKCMHNNYVITNQKHAPEVLCLSWDTSLLGGNNKEATDEEVLVVKLKSSL